MLSDREREVLSEVQRQFADEDPEFVRSFEAVDRNTQWSLESIYAKPVWLFTAALVVTVAVAALMMLLQAPATSFAFVAVAVGIAVLRHHRRCKDAGARGGG